MGDSREVKVEEESREGLDAFVSPSPEDPTKSSIHLKLLEEGFQEIACIAEFSQDDFERGIFEFLSRTQGLDYTDIRIIPTYIAKQDNSEIFNSMTVRDIHSQEAANYFRGGHRIYIKTKDGKKIEYIGFLSSESLV